MSRLQVLLVAGTHGNEINGPWLFDQWARKPELINAHCLEVYKVIGNPSALKAGRRYIDRDLNRSFSLDLLERPFSSDLEIARAHELLALYGPNGVNPCQIAIDIHSTTSAMGNCLVVYGRRANDLALAGLIQARLGLPIYLHEGDKCQKGFLVEAWNSGLVIEVGPVPQMVLQANIIERTKLALQALLDVLNGVRFGSLKFPDRIIIHRHMASLDMPRDKKGKPSACLHPLRQGADWHPVKKGDPLYIGFDGEVICYEDELSAIPVFINEAAYYEKQICMSFTKREILPFDQKWGRSFEKLIACG